jgi:dimethylamine/trimethylamine dehydrogenase
VTFVTPSTKVSEWAGNTLEQGRIQSRLMTLGVKLELSRGVTSIKHGSVETACTYTGQVSEIACDAVVLVTARLPRDELYVDLKNRSAEWTDHGIRSVKAIGDANAPAAIAWATYAGHRYAEELDTAPIGDALPFRREIAVLKS